MLRIGVFAYRRSRVGFFAGGSGTEEVEWLCLCAWIRVASPGLKVPDALLDVLVERCASSGTTKDEGVPLLQLLLLRPQLLLLPTPAILTRLSGLRNDARG